MSFMWVTFSFDLAWLDPMHQLLISATLAAPYAMSAFCPKLTGEQFVPLLQVRVREEFRGHEYNPFTDVYTYTQCEIHIRRSRVWSQHLEIYWSDAKH